MNAEEAASILSPLLSDPSNRLRRNLIEMMMQANYEAALPLVRPLLRDSAITVRETALAAVSKWGDLVSIDEVRNIAYNDPNPFVRPQAIITLTRLLGQDAMPDLVDLADDLNLHVRRAVAQCMAEMDFLTPESRQALLHLASDPDTAEFAKEALSKHDLTGIQPMPSPKPAIKVPVPEQIVMDSQPLLDLLETGRNLCRSCSVDSTWKPYPRWTRALSTLILYLRELNNGTH